MKRISRLAFTALASTALAFPASGGDLKVTVLGANPATGQFLVSVFNGEATWMKRPNADKTIPVSPRGSGGTVFSIPPGTYGVAIVHDANTDYLTKQIHLAA